MARGYAQGAGRHKELILGVDPGLAKLGLGLLDGDSVEFLTLETAPAPRLNFHTAPERLNERLGRLLGIAKLWLRPGLTVMAIETQDDVLAALTAKGETSRDAVSVQQVVGLLKGAAWAAGALVVEVSPAEVKAALTGSRQASKRQIQLAVQRTFKLAVLPDNHSADALSAAVAARRKLPLLRSVARGRRP